MSFMLIAALLALIGGPAAAGEAAFNPAILQSAVTVFPVRDAAAARAAGDTRGEERSGSGVVVRAGGYVATNYHVVLKARQVFVRLADGRELPAEVVASDETTDIALLRVAEELPPLKMGKEPPLGSRVCAVSDPFGVGLSVTCGVVSALRRTGMGFNMIEDFIQTDAVLNPGSSGGALVDGSGALVGMIAAIFTRTEDANIGINFAISTVLLNRVVDDLVAHGEVLPAYAGFRLSHLPRAERRTLAGLRIAAVEPGDAAERAGFRPGDVVTEIAGRAIRSRSDALTAIYLHRPGDRIDVTVVRDGQRMTFPLDIPK
jgi:S1-C subfamily serine protease